MTGCPASPGRHGVDRTDDGGRVVLDVFQDERIDADGVDVEPFEGLRGEVAKVLGDDPRGFDVEGQGEHVPVLLVHRHGVDQRRGWLVERGWQSAVHVPDPPVDRVRVEVVAQLEVAVDLVEDLRRSMRAIEVPGGHREDEVGDLDPVQHARVEDDDLGCHHAWRWSG